MAKLVGNVRCPTVSGSTAVCLSACLSVCLVEHKAVREGKDKHHKFRPSASTASIFEDVVALGGKSNNMKHQIKSTIQLRDVNHLLDHLKFCVVQGSVFRLPSFKGEDIWSKVVSRFNDKVFSFVINSIQDVLPHNVNLSRWRKSDTKNCPLCTVQTKP